MYYVRQYKIYTIKGLVASISKTMEVLHRSPQRSFKAKHQLINGVLLSQITILIFLFRLSIILGNPIVSSGHNVTMHGRNNSTVSPANSSRPLINSSTTRRPRIVAPASVQTRDGLSKSIKKTRGKATKVDLARMFPEEIEDYPESEINSILEKTPIEIKELFNVYNTHLDPNVNLTERVAQYADDDSSEYETKEERICKSVTRNIYPREARKNSVPVYIPNTRDFMQVIQAEICESPDRDCNYLQDALPYGMQSVCYQKYSYKKLLYLDTLENRMASDSFRYPSCCSCYVKTLSVELRSAGSRNSSAKHIDIQAQIRNSSHEMVNSSGATLLAPDQGGSGGHLKKTLNATQETSGKELPQDEEKTGGSDPLTTIIVDGGSTVGDSGPSQVLSSSQLQTPSQRRPKEAVIPAPSDTIITHEDKPFIPSSESRK